MAVASSRRPPEIEEEHREYEEQQKKACLKKKLNLNKVFMDVMINWYHNDLKAEDRKKLKKRHIIDKAAKVAFYMKLSFQALPPNWLRQLHDEHGVDFISFPPAVKAKIRAKRRLKRAYITRQISKVEMEKMIDDVMSGRIPPEMVCVDQVDVTNPVLAKLQDGSDGCGLIDLSDEPPPEFWISAFVNGQHLPRVLKVHKFEKTNQTVVYYDYDVRIKNEDGTPMGELMIHEANNFLPLTQSK